MLKKLLILIVLSMLIFSTSAGLSTATQSNHGQVVSDVAKSTEPGPDHGKIVSEAARNKDHDNNNYSLSLDGINDYLNMGDVNNAGARSDQGFSVETWINPQGSIDAYPNYQDIIERYQGISPDGVWGWIIMIDFPTKGDITFDLNNSQISGTYITVDDLVEVGKWMHIAVAYDGLVGKLYINGDLKAFGITPGGSENPLGVNIGYNQSTWNPDDYKGYYNGLLDEVRIWNKALTQDQIQANMSKEIQPQEGLVGYWQFDEGTGTTAKDSSGNGNDGTLVNGPTWTTDTPF